MKQKTYIGISRDHSVSMARIARPAAVDYNKTIAAIKTKSKELNEDTIISVVRCGRPETNYSRFNHQPYSRVVDEVVNSSLDALTPLNEAYYGADGPSTPLFDSVGRLIELLSSTPDANNPNTSFLVMAITDGEENSSQTWTASRLTNKIHELQRTGRWTFVFRVPRGSAHALSTQFGVPRDNILEWDQTEHGVAVATAATETAFGEYYAARSMGATATGKFYTNLADVSVKEVQAKLVDISSEVNLWMTAQKESIRPFCERMSNQSFVKGAAFYQLTKTEPEVQDYKQIAIRHKKTGAVYAGPAARQMLGLPAVGMAYVKPGDHGDYDIYIQSTSINRVLPPGTQLLYWKNHNAPISAPAPTAKAAQPRAKVAPKAQPVTAPMQSNLRSVEYQRGYSTGFVKGKAKSPSTFQSKNLEFDEGHMAGYKDGRGKKKRLYK